MLGSKYNQRGFTLLEMLISVALFSVVITIAIGLFFTSLQAQRGVSARQTAVAAGRYAVETMAQQIRNSEIAYAKYDNEYITNPVDSLWLYRADEDRYYQFHQVGNDLQLTTQEPLGGSDFLLLDATKVRVESLTFTVTPSVDPFDQATCSNNFDCETRQQVPGSCSIRGSEPLQIGFCQCVTDTDCKLGYSCATDASGLQFCLPPNQQPLVTISLVISPVDEPTTKVVIQTTVSSRLYQR